MSLTDGIVDTCPGVLNEAPAGIFLALINSLFAAQCTLQPPNFSNYGPVLKNGDTFDFIIVGGGTAGSVLANRLTENSKWNVLLIEAGTDPSITSQIPGLSFNLGKTNEDWDFNTLPQSKACNGITDRQCYNPCGKGLGGSTTTNTMLYIRGNKKDYNHWADLGNKGWNFDNVLQYFKKSEDNQQFGYDRKYHSTGGYLKVGYFRDGVTSLEKIIGRAAAELGYNSVLDFNSENWIGYGKIQGTVNAGVRQSTATSFLVPAKNRSNLCIAKGIMATKIIIDQKNARGVNVEINNSLLPIFARNEVIISAGTLNTPKLLMLSGIGPHSHLSQLNIPVIQNLSVGQNLQDHMLFSGMFITLKAHQDEWNEKSSDLDTIYEYFIHRKGDLAGVGLLDFMGFINSDPNEKYPNLQFEHIFFPKGQFDNDDIVLKYIGFSPELSARIKEINRNYPLIIPLLKYLHPKSRGTVKLRSKNSNDSPIIDPQYLKEKEDVEAYLKGIRYMEKLLSTPTFSKYKPEILDIKIQECTQYPFLSDNYWICYLKYMGGSDFHYVGTSKMGPKKDKTAVVDERLRVHGIGNLRIIDASIMPKIVSGNTMAPTIMIGEKGADLIKEDWRFRVGGIRG